MLRKTTVLLMLIALQTAFSCGYCEKIAQATTWYGIHYYIPHDAAYPLQVSDLVYTMGNDTVIQDKTYRRILLTHEWQGLSNAYRGAVRHSEDGQQVYFVPQGSENEYLLYDFNVQTGDVVRVYYGFSDESCEELIRKNDELCEDCQEELPATIQTVKEVRMIDGRKHVFVENEWYAAEWIEGIGTENIIWPVGRGCQATGMDFFSDYTLCAADSEGNILYSFDTDHLGIHNNCPDWEVISDHSSLIPVKDNIAAPSVSIILRDGQLYILRDGKVYTLQGIEAK